MTAPRPPVVVEPWTPDWWTGRHPLLVIPGDRERSFDDPLVLDGERVALPDGGTLLSGHRLFPYPDGRSCCCAADDREAAKALEASRMDAAIREIERLEAAGIPWPSGRSGHAAVAAIFPEAGRWRDLSEQHRADWEAAARRHRAAGRPVGPPEEWRRDSKGRAYRVRRRFPAPELEPEVIPPRPPGLRAARLVLR